ncbi:MAG TPA: aspartate aminotransferase family protein [Thermodesulfobacteriota bacterium]|nr:aspartate aminotransferase family protein [Thermodesulfobacteriota bacterium]
MVLPKTGKTKEEVLSLLRSFKSGDSEWHDGRLFGLIYYAGAEVEEMAREAYDAYMFENALSPLDFPSLVGMETEFISMAADLFGGDEGVVGSMTSGGTESILMAVKAARDKAREERPEITAPEMVVPVTAHPAFDKAAHYLGLKIFHSPVGEDFRADIEAVKQAITPATVFLAATAVTYPHGVIDPVGEIAAMAEERNIWFHVDACLGGYMLPFLKRAGYDIPPFDFHLRGVHSMSADIHKYGYVSKGVSTVLYRNADLRRHQFFVYADWPGGIYATPTLGGARPGGAIASAWAIFQYLGENGFLRLARSARNAAEKMIRGINDIPGLFVLGAPPATVFSFGARDLNIYQLGAILKEKGWRFHAQHRPASLHVTVSPYHENVVDAFLRDLRESVKALAEAGPSEPAGEAALYGMMGTLPDRHAVKDLALQYFNDLYRLKK